MITMTKKKYGIKPGTSKTWQELESRTEEITNKQYRNITNDETLKFFRRLGGSEYAERGYTSQGYKVVRLLSTSPDKQKRTERIFSFD